MRGVRGLLPGRQVTTRVAATVQRSRQVIIVIDVARRTSHIGMSSRQWKTCFAVVKRGSEPGIHSMAISAVLGRK
jgi:hypothetical protein